MNSENIIRTHKKSEPISFFVKVNKDKWVFDKVGGLYKNTVMYPSNIDSWNVSFINDVKESGVLLINTHSDGITLFAEKPLETFCLHGVCYNNLFYKGYMDREEE